MKSSNLALTMIRSKRVAGQQGYALLLVVFLTALLLITIMVANPSILTEGRRENEKELIWRGNQYVRAISLYRRKTGHLPVSIDELAKGQLGVHFLRKQYKDPMNKVDGSWRLMYAGPSGQIIGSLNSPRAVALPRSQNSATPGETSQESGARQQPDSNRSPADGLGSAIPGSQGQQSGRMSDNLQDSPTIIGAGILGVGSKVNAASIVVYNKARNYRNFEFIWDPIKEITVGNATPVSAIGTAADPLTPQQDAVPQQQKPQ